MELQVTVNRVLYPPAAQDGNWFVLLTDVGKCAGSMLWRPEQGERLTLTGRWTSYHGERNYKFDAAIPNVPANPRDMLRYVCDRTTGIGPAMEEAIWAECGAEWQDVEHGQVPRLTGKRYTDFRESISLLAVEREKSEAIGWLMGKGASVNMSAAAWEKWGKETVGVTQANCYRLTDLHHYGFVHVDGTIRANFRIADGDERRIRAAIIYSLHQLTSGGSTVIDWPSLRDSSCHLIGSRYLQSISDATSAMFGDGSLVGFPGTQSIALGVDYRNETIIWEWANGS